MQQKQAFTNQKKYTKEQKTKGLVAFYDIRPGNGADLLPQTTTTTTV